MPRWKKANTSHAQQVSLLLLRITNNLAVSKKIREQRRCAVQVFTKSVGHKVVDGAVERIMKYQQLLGEGNLCTRVKILVRKIQI